MALQQTKRKKIKEKKNHVISINLKRIPSKFNITLDNPYRNSNI